MSLYEIVRDTPEEELPSANGTPEDGLDRFLRELMGDSIAPPFVQVFTLPGKEVRWFRSADATASYVRSRPDVNVYIGVGLHPDSDLPPGERGGADRIAGIFGLWADIDIAGEGHAGKNYPPDWEAALALANHDLAPTLVVHSGHGLQAWWLFEKPWVFGEGGAVEADRESAHGLSTAWNKRLQTLAQTKGWKIDSTQDLARIMRVPGTTNHKEPRKPVTLVAADGARYTVKDFKAFLEEAGSCAERGPAKVGPLVLLEDAEPPRDKLERLRADPRFIATLDRERDDLNDSSPSGYDLSLASIAVTEGWSDQEIVDLLIMHRRQHGDDLKLREGYYERTIAKSREPGRDGRKVNGKRLIVVKKMSEYEPEEVEYLWERRLARGKMTIFAGEPGQGKTTLALYAASILSVGGTWPDGSRAPLARTLYFSAEDGVGDTLLPRLLAMGGDPEMVRIVEVSQNGYEVGLQLREDLPMLEEAVHDQRVDLLVIDPLQAVCRGIDSHKAAEVRAALAPVASMANRTGLSVLFIGHLNKGNGNPQQRINGSIDFVAAARLVLGVATDPEDDTRRLLLPVKQNLSQAAQGLAFRVADPGLIEWDHEPIIHDAWESLSPTQAPRSRTLEAKVFLLESLKEGPRAFQDLKMNAQIQGLSERSLRDAKKELAVLDRQGYTTGKRGAGQSYWFLPGSTTDNQTNIPSS